MVEVLRFKQASSQFIAPPIEQGLPRGLVLQLWIRRTGSETRQPIVELAGANSRIVLGTGDRADVLSLALIVGDKTLEISAPGALPIAHWVQVRAILRPDETAVLEVMGMKLAGGKLRAPGSEPRVLKIGGGFVGELAQLQVWQHQAPAVLSYDPPALDAPNLWAYYPLAALEWDAASKRTLVEDAGPHQRHAALAEDVVASSVATRVEHDEPLSRGQAAHLRFTSNEQPLHLSPLTGLSGKLTLEAWVCPVGTSPMPLVQLRGRNAALALVAGGTEGEITLLSISGDKPVVLARATQVARPNEWSHVAVSLELVTKKFDAVLLGSVELELDVGLYCQGQRRSFQSHSFSGFSGSSPARKVSGLIKQAMVSEVLLGGAAPGYQAFRGGMAEVRIWRGVAPSRLESLWLARARGDEDELIGCYRLDTDPSKALVDIGRRRGLAEAPSGISLQREQCPPLAASSGELAFRVLTRGKLVREWLPKIGTTKILLDVTNTTTGEVVHLSNNPAAEERGVFDATIEVATRSGNSPLDRVLDVRLDQPLTFLDVDGNRLLQTGWVAKQTYKIPLPASGRVRLRFAAEQLACPTIRVRVSGTPGGLWTIVRPDEPAQQRLRRITAQSLLMPSDGRRSPLPAGASDADAQALADAITRLGTQLVRESSASSFERESSASARFLDAVLDDALDYAEEGLDYVEEGVDYVVDAGQAGLAGATTVAKSAGQLIVRGSEELEALANKCAKAAPRFGSDAIAAAITSADQLAVVLVETGSSAVRWVEVVGTSIVEGSEVAWRAVVSGVDEALTAITKLIERIGAQIEEWIEYLASLFIWADFLDASDEALAYLENAMSGVGGQIAKLDQLKQQFADMLRESVEGVIGERSIADLFGIDVDASSPAFEQLDYLMEQVQRLFESAELSWVETALDNGLAVGPGAAVSAQAGELNQLQPLGDPRDVLAFVSTPIAEVLASNEQLANGSPSLFSAIFDPMIETSTELVEQIDNAMFSRLSVPWLTDMIEQVILGGRKLSVARIIALMAAIPVVLIEKTGSDASARALITVKSGGDLSSTEQNRQQLDRSTRWALWLSTMAGCVNAIVVVAKSLAEKRTPTTATNKLMSFLQLVSGSTGIIRGIIFEGRNAMLPPSTLRYGIINATAELVAGLCSSFFGAQGLKDVLPTQTRKDWSTVETAIQLILNIVVITSSGVALWQGELGDDRATAAFSIRCGSWVLSLGVRGFEKIDDRSATLKYFTMGLVATSFVVDIGEAFYLSADETEDAS